MEYGELKQGIIDQPKGRRAFLTLLFLSGCRVSEALALTSDQISYSRNTIYVHFLRLKGSKQTDPTELPLVDPLTWIAYQHDKIFDFSRTTAYRIVKRCFPDLYPHYFRMNRITKVADQFGDSTVYHLFGITASSIDHYRGKVDIKKVGRALQKEIGQ